MDNPICAALAKHGAELAALNMNLRALRVRVATLEARFGLYTAPDEFADGADQLTDTGYTYRELDEGLRLAAIHSPGYPEEQP